MSGWDCSTPAIDTKGVTRLIADLPRYCKQAAYVLPIVCIADSDGGCVVDLLDTWLPGRVPKNFVMRLAVTEAESWVLADHVGFASAFAVPPNKLPRQPDDEPDPKAIVLTLASRSKVRGIKEEVVSQFDRNRQGSGYNQHLRAFVMQHWDAGRAAQRSPSLARAIRRLQSWRPSPYV